MKVKTETYMVKGKTYHILDNEATIECSGMDCPICHSEERESREAWELTVPFPIPPKGKKYKRKLIQSLRGKTIKEICYTCKSIPCYICKRAKCDLWMKEEHRKGQEVGCAFWEEGFCSNFVCLKGIIKTSWKDLK